MMGELINYGGFALPRATVYAHAWDACLSQLPPDSPDRYKRARAGADMFAFGPRAKALSPGEAACLLTIEDFKQFENL